MGKSKIEKLGPDNYVTWAVYLKAYLQSEKLWQYVEHKEAPEGTPAAEARKWPEGQQQAWSQIVMHVEPLHLPALAILNEDPHAAWHYFKSRHSSSNGARQVFLMQQLGQFKMQPDEQVQQYVSRARHLQQQLQQAGQTISSHQMSCHILAGLTADFEVVKNSIQTHVSMTGQQLSSISAIEQQLLMAEAQLGQDMSGFGKEHIAKAHTARGAMQGRGRGRSSGRAVPLGQVAGTDGIVHDGVECYQCHRFGHRARQCPSRQKAAAAYAAGLRFAAAY